MRLKFLILFFLLGAYGSQVAAQSDAPPAKEAGQFRGVDKKSRNILLPPTAAKKRTLKKFYSRRAYSGAPPFIPHEIPSIMATSFDLCQSCHKEGGYVKKFKAFAPTTPHPEFRNCRQCHVSQVTRKKFKQISWKSVKAPKIHQPMLPGSPPAIPHSLQMRNNCSACHSGPSAIFEVRTSHPERVYCQQCHLRQETKGTWKPTAKVNKQK